MSHPAFPGRITSDDPDLTERQRRVFAALVEVHEAGARPVSSEALVQHADIEVSSASVRAELAALEGYGLLERGHASAGRVPTVAGYELYVRTLVTPAVLNVNLVRELLSGLGTSARDVRELLDEAARVLSTLTHQLGLALAASLSAEVLTGLDLEPLEGRRALLVLNLGAGAVKTLVLELETRLDRGELEAVARVLRERLTGHMLADVRERLKQDPELVRQSTVGIVARAAARNWDRPVETPLLRAGAMHIAEQPEFRGSIGPLLRSVESGSPLDRLLVDGIEGQVCARVGIDEDAALAGCSLVAYPLPGRIRGAVGVLGPMRMNYALAFAVVDAVGERIHELLES